MLKTSYYDNWGYPIVGPEFTKVVYALMGQDCYFSGAPREVSLGTSTINAAESVIEGIVEREKVSFDDFTFFDLQTYRAYSDKFSGFYTLDELVLSKENLSVDYWKHDIVCPPQVEKLFQEYIGPLDPDIKVWKPDEAFAAGYSQTEMHSNTNGYWISQIKSAVHERKMLNGASSRMQLLAQRMLDKVPQLLIFVDNAGFPEYIRRNEGERYCLWSLYANRVN